MKAQSLQFSFLDTSYAQLKNLSQYIVFSSSATLALMSSLTYTIVAFLPPVPGFRFSYTAEALRAKER